MLKINPQGKRMLISALIAATALVAVPAAYASNTALKDWRYVYPTSNSDDAGCQLCHGDSTSQLNAYGRDLCLETGGTRPSDWTEVFPYIEGFDSDEDPEAFDNDMEIANDTQPGWTDAVNDLYDTDYPCNEVAADVSVPSNVPMPYDLVTSGDPIANPGGPYEAAVNNDITFDGSGSTDGDGTIALWDWDFGDGTFSTVEMPVHAYAFEGVYDVTLTVTDDDGNENIAATTATISDPDLLDLDIADFSVTSRTRVGKSVSITLSVKNNGSILGQAIATVIGMQDSVQVYKRSLNVFDDFGKKATSFKFQSYKAEASGTIEWTATIADGDPDNDVATATTTVK